MITQFSFYHFLLSLVCFSTVLYQQAICNVSIMSADVFLMMRGWVPVCVSVMLWLYGKWLTISSALCIGAAVIMYCATWHNNDTLKLFCENKGEGTEFKAFSLGICKLSWALYGAVATACEYITQEPMLSSAAWFLFRETWLNFLSWFHILLFSLFSVLFHTWSFEHRQSTRFFPISFIFDWFCVVRVGLQIPSFIQWEITEIVTLCCPIHVSSYECSASRYVGN